MGTPDFSVPALKALAEAGHNVAGVVTQPDRPRGRGKKTAFPPVKDVALALNLEVTQPERIRDPAFIQFLKDLRPEVLVVVAYGKILPVEILELPPSGCINVHASLLPRYRGAAPIHRAVINGEKETGITTMYMEEGLDTGDMILQVKIAIGPDDTTGVVHDRLSLLGASLLLETLELVAVGVAPRVIQDGSLSTYAPPLKAEDERIHWDRTAQQIKDQVRGLNPWPGARTYLESRLVKIWRVKALEGHPGLDKPGTVVGCGGEGIAVQAGAGQVLIKELQVEGAKRMNAVDFLHGSKFASGMFFSSTKAGETE